MVVLVPPVSLSSLFPFFTPSLILPGSMSPAVRPFPLCILCLLSVHVTYGILEDQVAVAASAVKTLQWGGKHGHLALIVNKAKYRLITATKTNSVDR